MKDPFLMPTLPFLNQSTKANFLRYLYLTMSYQIPLWKNALQSDLIRSAHPKIFIFNNPQPPKSFGLTIFSQMTKWYLFLSLVPNHRKGVTMDRIFFKIAFERENKWDQYTDNCCNTDWINVYLPPKESHL